MTGINRVSRLCDYGVFRSFVWPSELPEFGRHNLIYGWNGTGKTTLSRLFRDLELGRSPESGEIVLRIDGHDLRNKNFAQSKKPVRVFNRDFVNENVFPVGRNEMPPILVLGAENIEKQQDVEKLKEQRANAQSNLGDAVAKRDSTSKDLNQFCIDRAKEIKGRLRSSGDNPYNNYDKSNFRQDAEQIIQGSDCGVHRLADAERDTLSSRLGAMPKPTVECLTYAFPDFKLIMGYVSGLLNTTIVSEVIETLKNDSDLADWVRQGLVLHRGRSAKQCKFCEQRLPKDRLAVLEAHFSDEYDQFIRNLDQQINDLQTFGRVAERLQLPHTADLYGDLRSEFESSKAKLAEAFTSVQEWLSATVSALENKKRHVFNQVKLEIDPPQVDLGAVEQLNTVIRKHNQACDDFEARIKMARAKLATDMIADWLEDFVTRKDATEHAESSVQTKEREIQRLDDAISRLEREIVEHLRPAEELTEDLRKYLGHGELCLEIKNTGYTIMRGGTLAKSLSEGETTAIALLYFLKSLQDRRFDLKKGVIVLDDPVSSLDANALFLAFGFIRERAKDAGQIFILTHNFSFFRQVCNWFQHLNGKNKADLSQRPARFFMLDSEFIGNVRSSVIRWLDPLLEQYESEYQYLFARVHAASTELKSQGLEQNYVLPNMARRLLESFLAFRLPQISGGLWQKLQSVAFDEAKKLRILRFLHSHSHRIEIGEPEHDLTALTEGPSVLNDLLEMIESLDGAHYKAMVDLVTSPARETHSSL